MVRTSTDMEKIRTTMIVYGNVQRSDYRGRVISIAKMMNITGTIQNLSDGTVKIIAEGEKINIERFCDEIDIKNFLIKVTKIERKEDSEPIGEYESFYKLVVEPQLKLSEGETDERLDTAAELLKQLIVVTKDGFTTLGKNITNDFATLGENTTNGFNKVGEKIDILREDTNQNFQRMDEKYSKLSEVMFAIVEKIEERNQIFEERIEKTDKNIELLLNILVKQK